MRLSIRGKRFGFAGDVLSELLSDRCDMSGVGTPACRRDFRLAEREWLFFSLGKNHLSESDVRRLNGFEDAALVV